MIISQDTSLDGVGKLSFDHLTQAVEQDCKQDSLCTEFLLALYASLSEAVLVIDSRGVIRYANSAASNAFVDLPKTVHDLKELLTHVCAAWAKASWTRHTLNANHQVLLGQLDVIKDTRHSQKSQTELASLLRDRELMFNLSELGIAFVRNTVIKSANEALVALSGYSAQELSSISLQTLFEQGLPQMEKALKAKGFWCGEQLLRRANGSLLWVKTNYRWVLAHDSAAGMIVSFINVDSRRRAEEAMLAQAGQTRAILDSVLVGIVTLGAHGIEWMNRSARRMFGGDLDDFIHQAISTVATPEPDHPFRRTQYLDELVDGEAQTFECRVQARDGRAFWVVGNVVVTSSKASGRQLTYALLDIDQRRQAQTRIEQAQASVQLIIEAAPLAIILWDASSLCIVQINAVAAKWFEHSIADCIGLDAQNPNATHMLRCLKPYMLEAIQANQLSQIELQFEFAGQISIWDARFLPLASLGQAPDKLLLVASDITTQNVAQKAKLDAAIQQREMLVREVHHRIKNNLQGVAGLLQQVAQRRPEVASVIFEVAGQVQAIAQVYGLQVGATGPLRLTSVLQAIASSVQGLFGQLIVFTADGLGVDHWFLPEVESIPIALTLNELLTNAIKHSSRINSSGITCTVHSSAPHSVQIQIANTAQLPKDFRMDQVPSGISGLGLIRALLPRRNASFSLQQVGARVVASIELMPNCVTWVSSGQGLSHLTLACTGSPDLTC